MSFSDGLGHRPKRPFPAALRVVANQDRTDDVENPSPYRRAGLDNLYGKYERFRKSDEEIRKCKRKKVRQFYERQNAILDGFKEVDELLDVAPTDSDPFEGINGETRSLLPTYRPTSQNKIEDENQNWVRWAINVNLIINIILMVFKILVVMMSNSMSLLASVVDSFMDLLSTAILFGASRAVESKDWRRRQMYPVGFRRAEPMGIVVFAVFMISSFVQVFIESCSRLFTKEAVVDLPASGVMVMLITIAIKIVVWFSCRGSKSSTIQALSQDAEIDVIFNASSLVFPWAGQQFALPWLDALGGAILSIYIIAEWIHTLRSNIRNLMGARSSADEHQRVAYLVTRFSPFIKAIQNIDVYSCGDQFIVEADLILPADISLPKAHNIGESVQYAIESLSGIERAYCHVDYHPYNPYGHVVR